MGNPEVNGIIAAKTFRNNYHLTKAKHQIYNIIYGVNPCMIQ